MKQVIEITLNAMQADMQRMDRVAANLANALTTAYQRQGVVVRAQGLGSVPFATQVEQAAASTAPAVQVFNDTRAGTFKTTGRALDVALSAPGLFEVTTTDGPAYTRAGDLVRDARGRLCNRAGLPVMGVAGEIVLTTDTPVIDAAGVVSEAGRAVGQIKVVRFENPESLERLGDGLYAPGRGMTLAGSAEAVMRQGALENANVSHMQEMLQMMQTLRHFESMQRVAVGYDDMIGTAVRKLGEF